jgi:malonyl CoA-acyl carrier protein transacylase
MGIYPALAICATISEGDALEMVARVGECMARVFRGDEYALGCVIGMEYARLEPIVARHGVYFANFNTSKHFLISGYEADVRAALDAASLAGAFSASIHTCDAPLHAPLMAPASTALREIFSDYRYAVPHIPLMSHRGELLEDPSHIRNFLHDELLEPVFWEKSWYALRESGVDRFVEVGVGDTLKKFNRWIESEYLSR